MRMMTRYFVSNGQGTERFGIQNRVLQLHGVKTELHGVKTAVSDSNHVSDSKRLLSLTVNTLLELHGVKTDVKHDFGFQISLYPGHASTC